MKLTIDRFEEFFAVCECEDGTLVRVPKEELPEDAREGSILERHDGGFTLCRKAEHILRERMENKLAAILKKK